MEMTPQRWRFTGEYARQVFGTQDAHLAGLMREAVSKGLPDIAVSADVGRLLMILASMTRGRLALELGTLAGYSAIWIARGLAADGRLITIEREPAHAEFARKQFALAGVDHKIELRCGAALDLLARLAGEIEPGSVDMVFLDAAKTEYPDYFRIVRPLVSVGGLVVADNALGAGSWWIDDLGSQERQAADQLNRLVAADPDFEAVAVPIRSGILIGRRMRDADSR